MTFEEVQELFVTASEVDRRLPNTARPARLRSQHLQFTHTWEDVNQWFVDDKKAREWDWLDVEKLKLSAKQVSTWERANELVALVPQETHRRALLHWARAMAGGKPFELWCRSEGIHRETGRRRKDRAIACIVGQLAGVPDACADPLEIDLEALLPVKERRQFTWADDEATDLRKCVLADWKGVQEQRNAMRRAKGAQPVVTGK